MAIWPKDHPGRDCAKCGLHLYGLWIDDTPPPGTCIENADSARVCIEARTRLSQGVQIADLMHKAPHPHTLAAIRKAGLTAEEIAAENALRNRVDAAMSLLRYGVGDKPPPWRDAFRAWIGEDPEARTLATLRIMLEDVDWADGTLTLAQLYENATLYAARIRRAADEIEHRDYETDGD